MVTKIVNKAVKLLHIDELVCLANCIREADEYMEGNDAEFRKAIGMSCNSAEALRVIICAEIDRRPEYLNEVEPWVSSPLLPNMSLEAISMLPTKELICLSNCINVTLEFHDNDYQRIRVGPPTLFIRVFRSALETELANNHGFAEHLLSTGFHHPPDHTRFPDITTREQYAARIYETIVDGTHSKALRYERTAYYNAKTKTIVIRDPRSPDTGACYPAFDGVGTYDAIR